RVLILAGEASGDSHGAELVEALKRIEPDVEIEAWGGHKLEEAGAKVHEDLVAHAVMGLFPVLAKLPYFIGVKRRILARISEWQPDIVIPIDYPGLNLRVAKAARRLGARVLYYVSPQVWAWWRSRVKRIGRAIDKMLVLFPFEVEFYRSHRIDVEYVGHPLLDAMAHERRDLTLRERLGISPDEPILAILPGSRPREIRKLVPLMLDVAKIVKARHPEARLVAAAARDAFVPEIEAAARERDLEVTVLPGGARDLMREGRVGLVASGTATLECLFAKLPMVICYRLGLLSWLGAKLLLATEHIGLANIVCGRRAVPEFFDWRNRPEAIAESVVRLFEDTADRERCLADLAVGRQKLGEPGASERAARAAIAMIDASSPGRSSPPGTSEGPTG
ncbi:MAG: lipid-A-disaccharide synthase, partial [Planctomycetota bacterium]